VEEVGWKIRGGVLQRRFLQKRVNGKGEENRDRNGFSMFEKMNRGDDIGMQKR